MEEAEEEEVACVWNWGGGGSKYVCKSGCKESKEMTWLGAWHASALWMGVT